MAVPIVSYLITELDQMADNIALVLSHEEYWVISMITSSSIMSVDSLNNTYKEYVQQKDTPWDLRSSHPSFIVSLGEIETLGSNSCTSVVGQATA